MWLLRSLKLLDLEPQMKFDYQVKEVRHFVEHGIVVWNSGLTKEQRNDIEKIHKVALKIILSDE